MAQQFTTGVFECHKNCGICIYTWCCTPCQVAQNKAGVDGRECNILDCLCCPSEYFTRVQIRSKYGMHQEPCQDCICAMCCGLCIICQDAREIQFRESAASNRPHPGAGQSMR